MITKYSPNVHLINLEKLVKDKRYQGAEVVDILEWEKNRRYDKPNKEGVNAVIGMVNASKEDFLEYQKLPTKEPMYRGVRLKKNKEFLFDPNLGSWYSGLSYASYVATYCGLFPSDMIPFLIKIHLSSELINSKEWGDNDELYIPENYLKDPKIRRTFNPISIGLVNLIKGNKVKVKWYKMSNKYIQNRFPVTLSSEKNMKETCKKWFEPKNKLYELLKKI